jgi:hypothetical protein
MRIFVDTNLLLDVLAKREPFYTAAARVWTMAETGACEAKECRVCTRETRRVDPSPPGLAQGDNLLCPGAPRSAPALRHKQRPTGALGLRTAATRMA